MTLPKTYRGGICRTRRRSSCAAKVVTVEADARCRSSSTASNRDNTPARFEVVPGALRVRVPAETCYAGGFWASPACAPPALFRAVDGLRVGAFFDSAANCFSSSRPLLELVEPSQLLLHLVQPRLGVVCQFDELRATGHVRELVQRFGSEILEPGEEVLLCVFAMARWYPLPPERNEELSFRRE